MFLTSYQINIYQNTRICLRLIKYLFILLLYLPLHLAVSNFEKDFSFNYRKVFLKSLFKKSNHFNEFISVDKKFCSEKKKKKKKIHSASKLPEQIGFSVLKIVRSGYQRCLKKNFLKILQYFS